MAAPVPGHPDPPHPPEDVVNAERIPAEAAVPEETQPAPEKACPNDLPAAYGTAIEAGFGGVPYTNGDGPGKDFYTKLPADARAIFSTEDGKKPFRKVDKNISTAEDAKAIWSSAELQKECNSLRTQHWHRMRKLEKPQAWTDLYEYFDAYDIYTKGPRNLWEALCHLCDENPSIAPVYEQEIAQEIRNWLDETRLVTRVLVNGKTIYVLSEAGWREVREIPSDDRRSLETVLIEDGAWLVRGEVYEDGIVAYAVYDPANRSSENSPFIEHRPCIIWKGMQMEKKYYNHSPGLFVQSCHVPVFPSNAAVEDLRRTAAAATPDRPRVIANVTSQFRPTSSVKHDDKKLGDNQVQKEPLNGENQQATASLTMNAASPNHHNQPHLSVNTNKNDIGEAVMQTQASPSPLPRKDRLAQHATTDGKSPLTHAQASSLNSPRPNYAKQPGTAVPKAVKPVPLPSQPRAIEMADAKSTWKGGNTVPSRAHPQNCNRNQHGRQVPEKMGQTRPSTSHGGPSTPSLQNRNQGSLVGNVPYVSTPSYGNGGFLQGNGSHNHAFGQHATSDGAFQTQLSHQRSAAAPGCNPPPARNTSDFRDGSYPRGNYGHKGPRDPRSYWPNSEYPVQAGKEPFYSQNTHHVDTRQKWHQSNTHHYNNNNNPNHRNQREMQCDRSVHVAIHSPPTGLPKDIKSRVRSNMARIFGPVDDAFLASRAKGMAFMVRFRDENSAVKALQSPNPIYLERDLSIAITPAYRSKWRITAGDLEVNKGAPGNPHWEPYQNATHSAMFPGMHAPPALGLAGPNGRGPHRLRPADGMMLNHVPHSLPQTGMTVCRRENRAHPFGPPYPQPVMPQQAHPQSPQGLQVPTKDASHAISRQQKKNKKKPVADREAARPLELKAQSKPPFDEAMENDEPIEKKRAETPTSQGSKSSQSSSSKVRVSLPSASPPKLTQSKAPKIEKPTKEPGKSSGGQDAPSKLENTPEDVIAQAQPPHRRQVSNGASSEVPLAVAKGSEALATTTTAPQARINFTEEEIKLRMQKSKRIPQPLNPRKAKRTTCTESNPGSAAGGKAASPEPLPPDTTCHVLGPAQQTPESGMSSARTDESRTVSASSSPSNNLPSSNPAKAEVSSVKSDKSRTVSASSSPSNNLPSSNLTKTPPNRNTAGSPSMHHSQVLKTPRSPTKNKAEANKDHKDQKPTSQVESVVKGEGHARFLSRADQDSFKFPGNGRETIRVKKEEKRETVCNEGSVPWRNTASKKRGWKNRSASRSMDFNNQNQRQASQPRVEVIRATHSATGNEASASATDRAPQKSAPRNTSSVSAGGIKNENLRNASGGEDDGAETGWQKVQRRRRTSKRTNTLESSDHQGEKPGMPAGRTVTASNTAVTAARDREGTVKLAVPGPTTTPKAGNASAGYPARGKRGSDSPMSERKGNKKPEAKGETAAAASRDPETTSQALGLGEAAAARPQQGKAGRPAPEKQRVSSAGSEGSSRTKTAGYSQRVSYDQQL